MNHDRGVYDAYSVLDSAGAVFISMWTHPRMTRIPLRIITNIMIIIYMMLEVAVARQNR